MTIWFICNQITLFDCSATIFRIVTHRHLLILKNLERFVCQSLHVDIIHFIHALQRNSKLFCLFLRCKEVVTPTISRPSSFTDDRFLLQNSRLSGRSRPAVIPLSTYSAAFLPTNSSCSVSPDDLCWEYSITLLQTISSHKISLLFMHSAASGTF